MPELVQDWCWKPNLNLADRLPADTKGMQVIVYVQLADYDAVKAYLDHPQHREVGAIQAPLLADKVVVDFERPPF